MQSREPMHLTPAKSDGLRRMLQFFSIERAALPGVAGHQAGKRIFGGQQQDRTTVLYRRPVLLISTAAAAAVTWAAWL